MTSVLYLFFFFFFQAEDGIRDHCVTGVQTCALPISQQALIQELREVIADYDQEGQETGDPHLQDSDALKVLVFVLRLALDRSSGRPLSRGFLEFLRTEFMKDENNTQSRIILP